MAPFQPRHPDWEVDCRRLFASQPIMRTLGVAIRRLEPGICELAMPFRPDLAQQNGFLQAGVVAMLADNAGGAAALTLMPAGADVLAVEFKINFLAPAKGLEMLARARVIKSGRTLTITAVDVAMRDGDVEVACAVMQQTCIARLDQGEPKSGG